MDSKRRTSKTIENDDCIIKFTRDRSFNVSQFLREHKEQPEDIANKMDEFALQLDKKVYINAADSKYKVIYDETDIIVNRLSNKLAQKHEMYTNTTVRRTGSIASCVKVGLPHETDPFSICLTSICFKL